MAKRKRLMIPGFGARAAADVSEPIPSSESALRRPPIADIAAHAATTSALETIAGEMATLKSQGRVIQSLPLDAIEIGYLVRDRLVVDRDELEVLKTSLASRGQQTPIEVVDQGGGRYGLISGFRRMQALRDLCAEGRGDDRVLALIRSPDTASDAYTAMVEENEIRVGLSYMDRASVVIAACAQNVFPSRDVALRTMFSAASRTKRSKIKSFLGVVDGLGQILNHPEAVTERQGLALAQVLDADPHFANRLYDALRKSPPGTAEAEQALVARVLARAQAELAGAAKPRAANARAQVFKDVVPGVTIKSSPKGIQITGPRAGEKLVEDLVKYLKNREE